MILLKVEILRVRLRHARCTEILQCNMKLYIASRASTCNCKNHKGICKYQSPTHHSMHKASMTRKTAETAVSEAALATTLAAQYPDFV